MPEGVRLALRSDLDSISGVRSRPKWPQQTATVAPLGFERGRVGHAQSLNTINERERAGGVMPTTHVSSTQQRLVHRLKGSAVEAVLPPLLGRPVSL